MFLQWNHHAHRKRIRKYYTGTLSLSGICSLVSLDTPIAAVTATPSNTRRSKGFTVLNSIP